MILSISLNMSERGPEIVDEQPRYTTSATENQDVKA